MGIREAAVWIVVAGLCIYAWKDWFRSLCGLILMMTVIEHESMPKSMLGISGFSPWNVLFLGVLLAWIAGRRSEGLAWDMPRHVKVLPWMFLVMVLISFSRLILSLKYINLDIVVAFLINPIKTSNL